MEDKSNKMNKSKSTHNIDKKVDIKSRQNENNQHISHSKTRNSTKEGKRISTNDSKRQDREKVVKVSKNIESNPISLENRNSKNNANKRTNQKNKSSLNTSKEQNNKNNADDKENRSNRSTQDVKSTKNSKNVQNVKNSSNNRKDRNTLKERNEANSKEILSDEDNRGINKNNRRKNQREDNIPKTKTHKKKRIWTKILIVILLAIIAFGIWFFYKTQKNGGGLSGMLATVVGHDENTRKNLPELKMLILGVSTDLGEDAPTDTIMIASYNPNTQKANLISIPRDTYVGKNKNKANPADKINGLYSFGGIEKILNSVNEITGLDIKYYAVVKTEALIKLVDAIGEVEFNVPINMKYDDPTQDLHINLQEGTQMINGEKAEQLLRYRHGNNNETYPEEYGDNDTGRMRTQREFIMAVMQQTLKPENIFKIGEILDIANNYLETNVDIGYLKDYIPYAVEFSTENMQTETLPGVNDQLPPKTVTTDRYWFFIHDEKETKNLMQKLFQSNEETSIDGATNNVTENAITRNTTNAVGTNRTVSNMTNTNTSSTNLTKSEIKIEVLNGSGNESKLEKAEKLLKDSGYNVTKAGKTSEISKTIITNKKELESDTVKEIKKILGTGSISNNKNLSSKVHVTIVIGKDFEL